MPDLIAIGEPLVEMAAESAGRLGDVDRFRCGWGGDTANFVLAAARLGGACGYVTRVGQDAFGRAFVAMLETHGVDARHVISDEEHHTGLYFVTYSEERKHRFDYVRRGSAASHLAGTDIDPDYVAERARPAREWYLPGDLTLVRRRDPGGDGDRAGGRYHGQLRCQRAPGTRGP